MSIQEMAGINKPNADCCRHMKPKVSRMMFDPICIQYIVKYNFNIEILDLLTDSSSGSPSKNLVIG